MPELDWAGVAPAGAAPVAASPPVVVEEEEEEPLDLLMQEGKLTSCEVLSRPYRARPMFVGVVAPAGAAAAARFQGPVVAAASASPWPVAAPPTISGPPVSGHQCCFMPGCWEQDTWSCAWCNRAICQRHGEQILGRRWQCEDNTARCWAMWWAK